MSRMIAQSRFAPALLRERTSHLGAAASAVTDRRHVTRTQVSRTFRSETGFGRPAGL
ncbi:hypothetical protein [Wenxinia saemankumensis]|uniref:Uncharacterized protein n=1 Tax=Wenxinia saemankumensis TaxID=1447782 RepID=A0A1M6E1W5_9RHOB|nr:hypothetical protein [Wenxinia saemankumensis]SHI79395.1 hypothetical protein SAMN05444417_1746 [Wenxinia saemankumensis]